ncbi:MAG: zinc ribbon domain-containing protein [Acidobacteria bacterium]|nr:zinc ribbon domain-containing protein [Acidobacteriota bacterium]
MRDLMMLCQRCKAELEEGFQFCSKCGAPHGATDRFFRGVQNRRSLYLGITLAVALFAGGLTFLAARQNQIASLKQGRRDGLTYAAWLAQESPSLSTLQAALGKAFRDSQVAAGRSIAWFKISDGFLGVESPGGFIHFRPNKPALHNTVLSRYQRRGDPVTVAGGVVTNYEGPNDLALTALASEKQPAVVNEFIVWKRSEN